MYNNMMTKFKFGNFKKARYLDHESVNMFYPVMMTTFLDLARNLEAEGHGDLAIKALHKFDDEMPNLYPYIDVAGRKMFMAQMAYRLGDISLGNKFTNEINGHLKDQLDFNYYNLQNNQRLLNQRDVQIAMQVLNGLTEYTLQGHQDALHKTLAAELKDYAAKFAPIMSMQQ